MEHVPKVEAIGGAGAQPLPGRRNAAEERELVGRAQRGDQAAYEQLVKRNQQRVSAVVGGILRRREDIEDVAQQVFIKAYFSLKRFDQRSAFSTWLYKITVNECWDYLRKKRVRPLVYEADLSEDQARQLDSFVSAGKAPTDSSDRVAMRQQVERLLDQLNPEDRQMMLLKEVEGFSVEEVGDILGLNVNTVKVRLFRARARLVKSFRRRKKEIVPAHPSRSSASQGKD
ncbi:MAG: RNA polymerase sigma factor [Candidatus Acidiferrales bacterium]